MKVVWLLGRIGAVQLQHAGMISCMSSILSLMSRVLKLCLCCGVTRLLNVSGTILLKRAAHVMQLEV